MTETVETVGVRKTWTAPKVIVSEAKGTAGGNTPTTADFDTGGGLLYGS